MHQYSISTNRVPGLTPGKSLLTAMGLLSKKKPAQLQGTDSLRLGINLINARLVRLVMPTLIHRGEETYCGI